MPFSLANDKLSFSFRAKPWLVQGKGGWVFVSLPKKRAVQLRALADEYAAAWGSIRVRLKIGDHKWESSLFPDTRRQTYLLPLKADVRRKTGVMAGKTCLISLEILGRHRK